jgi:hypothetical protein
MWVEMYHFSRNKVTDPVIFGNLTLPVVFVAFSSIAYAGMIIFAIFMEFSQEYDLGSEAVFLTILTLSAMIVFVHYGYLTHKRMDRVPLFPPHRKTKRLNRVCFRKGRADMYNMRKTCTYIDTHARTDRQTDR